MTTTSPLLGAHMSTAGGLHEAINRGMSIDCTAIQFFSKNNRQWHAKPLDQEGIDQFKTTLAASNISITVIHASYLINIGSPDEITRNRSIAGLITEYERASILDVDYLVFHPGSHRNAGEQACLERIAHGINTLLAQCAHSPTTLLLETMAGQGTNTCYSFEQLATIYSLIDQKDRVGVCLDTCHIFAAGYDIANEYENVMQSFDDLIGLSNLKVIHVNDSKKACGSRVDRHEHIGKGAIGLKAFSLLMNDERLKDKAKILETPKDSLEEDRVNLAVLRSLLEKASK